MCAIEDRACSPADTGVTHNFHGRVTPILAGNSLNVRLSGLSEAHRRFKSTASRRIRNESLRSSCNRDDDRMDLITESHKQTNKQPTKQNKINKRVKQMCQGNNVCDERKGIRQAGAQVCACG